MTEELTDIEPIYKTKDGQIVTHTQLLESGYAPERINKGLQNGILLKAGDTKDANQSFKTKDGQTVTTGDLLQSGYSQERIDKGVHNGILTPHFETAEKKNSAEPSKPLATPSALPAQETKNDYSLDKFGIKKPDIPSYADVNPPMSSSMGTPKFKDINEEINFQEKQKNNVGEENKLGYIWNKFTDAVGGQLSAAGDIKVQLDMLMNPAFDGLDKKAILKKFREEEQPKLRSAVTDIFGSEVNPTKEQKYNKNFLLSAAAGVVGMIPALVGTKGTGFILQAYDSGLQGINNTEAGKNLPEVYKTIFATGSGIAMGVLMSIGIDKIVGKQTEKIAAGLAATTFSKLLKTSTEPITKDIFEAAIKESAQTLKQKIIAKGGKLVEAAGTGAIFMGTNEAINITAEHIVNKATGKEVFEPKTWGQIFGGIAHSAAIGAFGGVALGAAHIPFAETRNYIKEKVSEATTKEDIQALREELISKAAGKNIEGDYAEQVDGLINEYVQKYSKIPTTANNKAEIADKMDDRDNLQQHIEDKTQELQTVDPAFQKPILEEINAAKGRLDEMNQEMVDKSKEPTPIVPQEDTETPQAVSVGVGGDVMKGVMDKMRQTELEMEFAGQDNVLDFKNNDVEIVVDKPIGVDKYQVAVSEKSNSNTGFTLNEGKTKLFDTKLEALEYAKEQKEQSLKETTKEGDGNLGISGKGVTLQQTSKDANDIITGKDNATPEAQENRIETPKVEVEGGIKALEETRDKEIAKLEKPEIDLKGYKLTKDQIANAAKLPSAKEIGEYKESWDSMKRLKRMIECL